MKITPQNISKAVNISFGKFNHFRVARGRFMSQMVGRFYQKTNPGDREDRKAAPLNLLASAVGTLVPNLVYNDPKIKVRTDVLAYRNYADILELAGNHLIHRIDLRMALRKAIVDSIFMAGFIKTGISAADQYLTLDGLDVELGQPYAERVDPDDMILDPMARDWDEQSFIGNKFRANLDDLQQSGLYDADLIEKLSSRYDGMSQDGNRAEKVMGDNASQQFQTEVQRYVDLVEVYMPREKVILTLPYSKDQTFDQFLRVADHEGPDKGPYHMLGYTYVPDNILPVAPAMLWYDLHILGNRIARKLARQSERIKRVLAYTSNAVEDVNEIAEADDGETVRVDDINNIKEVQYGGSGQESYDWMAWVKQHFSEQAGNIDLLNGVDTNTPTATQAQMLQANTSVRLSDMQNMVYSFTADISRDLVFFLHTDPLIEVPLIQRQNGVEQQVVYTPEMRQGNWVDYNLRIQPFSMSRPDPNTAVRRKIEFATNAIPAAAQAAALLGPGFNVGAFLTRLANEVGIEDADEWLNTPQMQAWIMQRMMMQTGDPGKAGGGMIVPPAPGAGSPPAINPGQPNPTAMGPNGGISPDTEQAMAQQEMGGQLQSAFYQASTNARAQAL
jgi:hypothetical protein